MPSFDIVSKVDTHELNNAVDQANREVQTRFDFKGSQAQLSYSPGEVTLSAQNPFQLQQMLDILYNKMSKRQVDIRSLEPQPHSINNSEASQVVLIKQGIEAEAGKKLIQLIKNQKFKVQASIQGDQVRVTSKKRDDLQAVINFLRAEEQTIPLQFENFRD